MNERVAEGEQMSLFTDSIQTVIEKIAWKMLRERPEKEVYYMPFVRIPGVYFDSPLGFLQVDLNQIYPEASDGDWAAVDFLISTLSDEEIFLNIEGETEVFYQGEPAAAIHGGVPDRSLTHIGGAWNIPLAVSMGEENRVRVVCTRRKGGFGFRLNISVRRYPGMWANDYLACLRVLTAHPDFTGEEGVAVGRLHLAGEEETAAESYCYPEKHEKEAFRAEKLGFCSAKHLAGQWRVNSNYFGAAEGGRNGDCSITGGPAICKGLRPGCPF